MQITASAADRTVNYVYGPEHQRVRQTLSRSANGFVFAQLTKESGTGAGANKSRYLHYDHLGSIAAISNTSGAVVERLAYDPWGKRRSSNAAASLEFLRVPPQNRLEQLKRDRKGQWSIRINDQFRLCFEWRDGHAWNAEIVDYH